MPYKSKDDRKLLNTYRKMKSRCYKTTDKQYKNYGGRGIKVCERWLHSFKTFKEDMGPRPPEFQIDRIEVNGDYCPENCRWVDPVVNSRNKRNTIYVWLHGMKLDLMTACQLTGRSNRAIRRRNQRTKYQRGWQECFDAQTYLSCYAVGQKIRGPV